MSDLAISIEGLSKLYRLGELGTGSIAHDINRWWHQIRRKEDPYARIGQVNDRAKKAETEWVWALKDVAFDVHRGEVLGIIGANGAGKSTLLKILSQITAPTKGQVKVRGRIASLLEVGTGFHPELTGRENIYLNGAILGMRKKEIDEKLDEIVNFSACAAYVDTPVKRYSSGMQLRLAFAVAAHLEPEILVIDEVLAVGDAEFQKKCLGKMREVNAKRGRTILFVSHHLDMVRSLCNRAILLEHGQVRASGSPDAVFDQYSRLHSIEERRWQFSISEVPMVPVAILRASLASVPPLADGIFSFESAIVLTIDYRITDTVEGAVVNFELSRNNSTVFLSFDTDEAPYLLDVRQPGDYSTEIAIPRRLLKPGIYTISLNTGRANTTVWHRLENCLEFEIEFGAKNSSLLSYSSKRPGAIACPLEWKTVRSTEWEAKV